MPLIPQQALEMSWIYIRPASPDRKKLYHLQLRLRDPIWEYAKTVCVGDFFFNQVEWRSQTMPGYLSPTDESGDQQLPQAHGTVTVIDSIEAISADGGDATIETIWQKAIEMTGFGKNTPRLKLIGFQTCELLPNC